MLRGIQISGKKLVQRRKEMYWSRDELGERAKVTRGALQRIEQADVTGVSVRIFRKLAHAFGVSPAQLEGQLRPGDTVPAIHVDADTYAGLAFLASEEKKTIAQYLHGHVTARGWVIAKPASSTPPQPPQELLGTRTRRSGGRPAGNHAG